MKMNNFTSIYMAIHVAADIAKALEAPLSESPFKVGDSQLKSLREAEKRFEATFEQPNRDVLPPNPL